LLIGIFDFMRNRENIEDLIAFSLKEILKRSLTLDRKDQIAINQEFKEWIHGVAREDDIWVVNNPIN
tara:strand:+ start:721 stop:921 length:201 start_codon:yes stop_codon:yes gene_type:complete